MKTNPILPWVPEVFLACGGNFRYWPKAEDLTQTGNRARKISGTQSNPIRDLPLSRSARCTFAPLIYLPTFLTYKRETFILGVLGFLKTTRLFPKIPEEVRSLPKTSKVCRRRSYRENAYPQNQRSRGRYCHLFILHMVFVPYMGLS